MMSHFLFIENEDLVCKYGFHMLSRWKLVTQDRPLWLDQLCGTGRVSGVRVVRVCNIQKRKGLVYHVYHVTFQYISHFTYTLLFWNPMDMVHTVHTASLQSGRPLVAASVTRLSTCLRDFFCIGNEIRHFEITFKIHDFWDYFRDFLRFEIEISGILDDIGMTVWHQFFVGMKIANPPKLPRGQHGSGTFRGGINCIQKVLHDAQYASWRQFGLKHLKKLML